MKDGIKVIPGEPRSLPRCEPREKMRADEMVDSRRAVVTMPALSYLAELREQSNNRRQN